MLLVMFVARMAAGSREAVRLYSLPPQWASVSAPPLPKHPLIEWHAPGRHHDHQDSLASHQVVYFLCSAPRAEARVARTSRISLNPLILKMSAI